MARPPAPEGWRCRVRDSASFVALGSKNEMRQCSKCGKEKSATREFFKVSLERITSRCRECAREYSRRWVRTNPDRRRSYYQGWREKNLERLKTKDAERYAANPARKKDQAVRWRLANSERKKLNHARWYRLNAVKVNVRSALWRKANPDKFRAALENRRAQLRDMIGKHTGEDIRRIYQEQKGRCKYCSIELLGTFHVDHQIPISRGGTNWPNNLACACPKCNTKKNALTANEFLELLRREANGEIVLRHWVLEKKQCLVSS